MIPGMTPPNIFASSPPRRDGSGLEFTDYPLFGLGADVTQRQARLLPRAAHRDWTTIASDANATGLGNADGPILETSDRAVLDELLMTQDVPRPSSQEGDTDEPELETKGLTYVWVFGQIQDALNDTNLHEWHGTTDDSTTVHGTWDENESGPGIVRFTEMVACVACCRLGLALPNPPGTNFDFEGTHPGLIWYAWRGVRGIVDDVAEHGIYGVGRAAKWAGRVSGIWSYATNAAFAACLVECEKDPSSCQWPGDGKGLPDDPLTVLHQ